ncbi:hypothetical protein [Pseudovibrio sp. WM33]|uniref:hypothetical protein n=1 Tax=Pseudovibrio sp. WM33 TaxID=1735585 RepID=UPI0007AE765F|nr:hypothetical protein [Pseudovibrio sp. WM33]
MRPLSSRNPTSSPSASEDGQTEKDKVDYVHVLEDKIYENPLVMTQIENNTKDQAKLGGFQNAIDNAIITSGEAHQKMMIHLLSNLGEAAETSNLLLDLMYAEKKNSEFDQSDVE